MKDNLTKIFSAKYHASKSFFAEKLSSIGLKFGYMMYVMCICDFPGCSQECLAERLHVDKSTAAKAIKQLLKLEYVTREQNQNDMREYIILPTKKAIDIYGELTQYELEWSNKVMINMTEKEKETFRMLLDKIPLD